MFLYYSDFEGGFLINYEQYGYFSGTIIEKTITFVMEKDLSGYTINSNRRSPFCTLRKRVFRFEFAKGSYENYFCIFFSGNKFLNFKG
jgi:hypothetical protein